MIRPKKYNLAQQYNALKVNYPHFAVMLRSDCVNVKGQIKPTARSILYSFKLKYQIEKRPEIKIVYPILEKNFNGDSVPHVYSENELCLYYPKFREFNSTMLIADYLIPWISLWLYHYENWHLTGNWEGGGKHLAPKEKKIKKSK